MRCRDPACPFRGKRSGRGGGSSIKENNTMGWVNGMGVGIAWMWIFPVLFLTGLALFLGMALRGWGRLFQGFPESPDRKAIPEETSKEILDRRYSKGEITREQYLQMRKDME